MADIFVDAGSFVLVGVIAAAFAAMPSVEVALAVGDVSFSTGSVLDGLPLSAWLGTGGFGRGAALMNLAFVSGVVEAMAGVVRSPDSIVSNSEWSFLKYARATEGSLMLP